MPPPDKIEVLQGTLDLLILRTLQWGPQHGHGIGQAIRSKSGELLLIEHGSLYPALHRLQREGWIESEWGVTQNNRKRTGIGIAIRQRTRNPRRRSRCSRFLKGAKFYRLTETGKSQLAVEESKWKLFVKAMSRTMRPQE